MTPCPVCQHPNCAKLWEITAEEAARHFVSEAGDDERFRALTACIKSLWDNSSCTIRRCPQCTFGYADPFVAGDMEFYKLSAPREGYPTNRWEYNASQDILEACKVKGGKILEIGAGPGQFLKKVVPQYFKPTDVTAFEYNSRSIAVLRDAGYNAFQGDFREQLDPNARFRAIFMFQVLEHLDQQQETFAKLKHLLEPGGHLFISVPNPDRIHFNESTGSLRDMPPAHIGRWREETFRHVAEVNGLELASCQRAPVVWRDFFMGDIGYYYLQRAAAAHTFASWSRSKRDKPYGKLLMRTTGAFYAPPRLAIWMRHASSLPKYGVSLLAHFHLPSSSQRD